MMTSLMKHLHKPNNYKVFLFIMITAFNESQHRENILLGHM